MKIRLRASLSIVFFVFLILFYYATIDEQTKRRELQFVLTKSDLVSSKLLTTMQVEIPLPLNL